MPRSAVPLLNTLHRVYAPSHSNFCFENRIGQTEQIRSCDAAIYNRVKALQRLTAQLRRLRVSLRGSSPLHPTMADQQAVSSRWVAICIALMLTTTATAARPCSRTLEAAEQGTTQSDPPAAAGPAGSLKPGTPAVTPSSSSAASSAEGSSISQAGGNYGWLSPVLAGTRRGNCVVYTVSHMQQQCMLQTRQLVWKWLVVLLPFNMQSSCLSIRS